MRTLMIGFALSVLLSCSSARLAVSADCKWGGARAQAVCEMKQTIAQAMVTTSPHSGGSGANTIFTGNVDYHSAVHAHWALLSMARITEDAALESKMLGRLTLDNLKKERAYLLNSANVEFETPYGRVWLLLLLHELSKHNIDTPFQAFVSSFRTDLEAQLLDWLETVSDSYLLRADHYSWEFAFWMMQLSQPIRPDAKARMQAVQQRLVSLHDDIMNRPIDSFDFLYLPSLLAGIDRFSENYTSFARDGLFPALPAAGTKIPCHLPGALAVRLWPIAWDNGKRVANPYSVEFTSRFDELLSRKDLWRNDFACVGHWVPQFYWLTLMQDVGVEI